MTESYKGVLSYWNMKEYDSNKSPEEITEYPLFTDANIIGELTEGCEPYSFLNMIAGRREPGIVSQAIVLRIGWYISGNQRCEIKTDTSKYHGGWVTDEIAALASLKLGIRLKSGDMSRIFNGYSKDPLGTPRAPIQLIPQLNVRSTPMVLPNVIKTVNLANLAQLKKNKDIKENRYVSLVRSSRLYQDALWIAESEPALSWLMLVSAVETAAHQWSFEEVSATEKLKQSKPELAELLIKNGGNNLLREVADQIAPSLGATQKFIKFCLQFMPDPPTERPIEWAQIKWTKTNLRKILNKLYGYRSNALHGGTPFPEPMCKAPEHPSPEIGIIEKGSTGLATHTLGASWISEDLPINLNMFNYMVNGILNNWWLSLIK